MIKLIVFDLWKTLGYRNVRYSTTSKMLRVMNSKIPKDKFVKIFENSLQTKKWKSKKEAYTHLCKKMNLHPTEKNVNTLMEIRDYAESMTRVYKHTLPLLKKLKSRGFKIGLISNSSIFTMPLIRKTSILKYVDYSLFSFETGVIKPDLKIFRRMITMSGFSPHEILMIGDKMGDDIIPSRKVGMYAIHFKNFRQLKKELRSFSINL